MTTKPAPSRVSQRDYATPFVGSFGKFEREYAAALYVEACIRRGDTWLALGPRDFYAEIKALLDEKPRINWIGASAAFGVIPDVRGLVDGGWLAMAEDKTVQPTETFFAAIARYVREQP